MGMRRRVSLAGPVLKRRLGYSREGLDGCLQRIQDGLPILCTVRRRCHALRVDSHIWTAKRRHAGYPVAPLLVEQLCEEDPIVVEAHRSDP